MVSQVCHEEVTLECQVCHTMYIRECHINMEMKNNPVKVKMCMSVQGDTDCIDGYRRSCQTRYESVCGTRWQHEELHEDRPICGVEMVGKCPKSQQADENASDSTSPCMEVPVMKCRIEKRLVKRRMPKTACRRIPRKFCIKKKCKPKKTKCFNKLQMISKLTPVESCDYSPKKICQETDDPEKNCRTVKTQVCEPEKNSHSTVKRKICQKTSLSP